VICFLAETLTKEFRDQQIQLICFIGGMTFRDASELGTVRLLLAQTFANDDSGTTQASSHQYMPLKQSRFEVHPNDITDIAQDSCKNRPEIS
jgi:hypothetical protein